MSSRFPGESNDYRHARDELLRQEIELRRQMEAVAVARRQLPRGGAVQQDYVFDGLDANSEPAKVKLSQLFRPGSNSLVIYNFMFPRHKSDTREAALHGETSKLPRSEQPCPSCTGLIDQLNAAVPHFEAAGGSFAVVANAPLDHLLAVARDRDWHHVRLLSSAHNTFKRDYHAEDDDGQQVPLTTVFQRDPDETIRLFWASELSFAPTDPGQDPRAQGTLEPFWNMLDLTPEGRPNFDEQMQYECCEAGSHLKQ